jgi:hypothetical protein
MIENDFSQLPVIDESGRPSGMVTHESILRALDNFGMKLEELRVSNAIADSKAKAFRPEDDLYDLLDRLKETNAVLIVDGEGKLIGIVTSYDSTEYYRRRAEDMMLVQDVESMLKDLVLIAFVDQTGETDRAKLRLAIEEATCSRKGLMGRYQNALKHYLDLQDQRPVQVERKNLEESFELLAPREEPKEFDDLTMNDYCELLLHQGRWNQYRAFFDLAPGALRKLLGSVRDTRNVLAHFRREITPVERDQLRFCADFLALHPAERLLQQHIGIPVDWPVHEPGTTGEPALIREPGPGYETPTETETLVVPTDEDLSPTDSRYAPLALWLQGRPSKVDRVQLSYEEVEKIIGGPLPPSAHTHRAWWANDSVGHVQSQQWLDVGWRVAQINMTEKRVTFARIRERETAYIDFFSALLARLSKKAPFPPRAAGPDGCSWLTVASLPEPGPKWIYLNFSFTREKRFRIELYIDSWDELKNKLIFNGLYSRREAIQAALDEEISWERLDGRRASRIALYRPGSITDGKETLEQLRKWAADAVVRFYDAFAAPAAEVVASIEQVLD